jgi:hypothetical protein
MDVVTAAGQVWDVAVDYLLQSTAWRDRLDSQRARYGRAKGFFYSIQLHPLIVIHKQTYFSRVSFSLYHQSL